MEPNPIIDSDTPCQCTGAGFCSRYQKQQTAHHVAICKGEVLTPEKCKVYRFNWLRLVRGEVSLGKTSADSKIQSLPNGPGTELKKLFGSLGVKEYAGCNCERTRKQMDLWGVVGCREHFSLIREWLVEAQAKAGWFDKILAMGNAVASGIVIDPLDIAGSLIRLAIARAEVSQASRSE